MSSVPLMSEHRHHGSTGIDEEIQACIEGLVSEEKRQALLNLLVSLTGKRPTRLIEHRIYLTDKTSFHL